jgi:hypothetical protein
MTRQLLDELNLTICSVSFHSRDCLELNLKLTKALNTQDNWTWIIINNSPRNNNEEESLEDDKCLVIDGVSPDTNLPYSCIGSYHHATALNRALDYIKTRYLLILDPDFYIVRQDWVQFVVDYMESNHLVFFGVPWHPKWYTKYRYFPCVHCLFIDLNKISKENIDFTPNILPAIERKRTSIEKKRLQKQEKIEQKKLKKQAKSHNKDRAKSLLQDLWDIRKVFNFKKLEKNIRKKFKLVKNIRKKLLTNKRQSIGASHDTGYKIFELYGNKLEYKTECALPVFRPAFEAQSPEHVLWYNKVYEHFLPDRLCFIPKKRGSYSRVGFGELGYPDVTYLGWEEFIWQGRPFGFHLRSLRQDKSESDGEKAVLADIIETIIRQQPSVGVH